MRSREVVRRTLLATLVAAVVLAAAVESSVATARPRLGGALGLIAPAGRPSPRSPVIQVLYHGGPVMRSVRVHTVFWAPAGYRFSGPVASGVPGYEALIKQFLRDVAGDSGSATSVFSVLPEFSDGSGPGRYDIRYDPATDSIDDAGPYPQGGRGCASAAGIATCVTDAGLRHELDSVIAAHAPSARGLGDVWLVFLPPNVDECITPGSCATNAFGGYHSLFSSGGSLTVYAPVPDPTVEVTPPPGSDPQGNPTAESAIDTVAHELVEAITDPTGVGWMDPNGSEVGDKCESGPQYGQPLGFAANGSPYNQVIGGHQYLLQMMWSNGAPGCVQQALTGTVPAAPLPQVYLTQFSAGVSGSTGGPRGGVAVRLLLSRAGEPVAIGRASTRRGGSWGPVMLRGISDGSPRALGDDRDVLTIQYGRGGPPPEAIQTGNGGNPFTQSGWTGWYDLDTGFRVSARGSRGAVTVAPCSQTGVLALRIGGVLAPSPTDTCAPDTNVSTTAVTRLTRRTPIALSSADNRAVFPTDPSGALVRLRVRPGEPGSVAAHANPLVPFDQSGLPECTGDLQYGRVACSGLVPGQLYTLVRGRGRLTVRVRAGDDGVASAHAFTGRPRLRGGDVVRLLGAGRRVLSVLHVAHLRVAIDGTQSVVAAGACEPGEYFGPGLTAPPTSIAAVVLGVAGSGTICPLTGDAAGLPVAHMEQTDDRSGGTTRTEVPVIEDTSPTRDETVHGSFLLLAGVGFPGPHGSVVPSSARVSVTVTPAAPGSGSAAARPVLRVPHVNTAGGVRIGPLASGVYRATWVVTDANGDTRTVRTRFIAG